MFRLLGELGIGGGKAEKSGLVARVIPADQLLEETQKAAAVIAGFSLPVVMMVKESVNRAFESSLNEGLLFERRAFHASFGLEDQKEGMAAFDQVFPQRGSVYFQAPAGSPCEAIEARCKSGSDLHRSQSALA